MSEKDLISLAIEHGTDKWNGHWYAQHYDHHLSYLREKPITLLEIGVGGYDDSSAGGASLRMWRDYFHHATIHGLDYYDKSPHAEERIRIHQGSQVDPVAIARIINECPDGFDVVVDDGSHRSEHIIGTLNMLWPSVKNGGWYIIEDVQTAYWPSYGGAPYATAQQNALEYLQSLVHCLNWEEVHRPGYSPNMFDTSLVALHFYHNMAFLRKGENREGSNTLQQNVTP